MKEILIELRDRLITASKANPHRFHYMCQHLDDMKCSHSILKDSGLRNLWESRGNTAYVVWRTAHTPIRHSKLSDEDYIKLTQEKIDCLNIIINRL